MVADTPAPIEDIVDQHFEGASLLWLQREVAATASSCRLKDLVEIDDRLEAHIDGLRLAGDGGWALYKDRLDHDEPGTVFAAGIIAFESGDAEKIETVVNVSNKSQRAFRAITCALGWLEKEHFKSIIVGLVSHTSRQYRSIGIAACGERRANPRAYLNKTIESTTLFLKIVSLKAAGELKRADLLPALVDHFNHEEPACRFEAIRSAILLGDRSKLSDLSSYVLGQTRYTLPAAQIAFRLVDGPTTLKWLKALYSIPEQRHFMLTCAGITGNPSYIPMLIKQMRTPQLARAAGDAFSVITGIKLSEAKLVGELPEVFTTDPNDDADDDTRDGTEDYPGTENIKMDQDEGLDWPSPDLVTKWWEHNSAAFPPGIRFLAGSPITPEHCVQVLKTGHQRDRGAAALELALSHPEAIFFNTRSQASRQLRK